MAEPNDNFELRTKQEVDLFVLALDYNKRQALGEALRSLDVGFIYGAVGISGPVADGYKKTANHIHTMNLQSLSKKELDSELLKLFPSGGYSEDMRYNISEIYKKITEALAKGQFKGFRENTNNNQSQNTESVQQLSTGVIAMPDSNKSSISKSTLAIADTVFSYNTKGENDNGRGQRPTYNNHGVTSEMLDRLAKGEYNSDDVSRVRQMIAETQGEHRNLVVSASGADVALSELWKIQQKYKPAPVAEIVPPKAKPVFVGTVTADQLNFDNATPVISGAQKFIIPIPPLKDGGVPLVYPAGEEKAGQAIADWEGKPIGERGVVFRNHKDNAVQAVAGDGTGVIIINNVDDKMAGTIHNLLVMNKAFPNEGMDANNITKALEAIALPKEEGGWVGVGDMYNSTGEFVKAKMTHVNQDQERKWMYGLFKRDDKDICKAVYVAGQGEFQGPAATPQKFKNGAVFVYQTNAAPPIRLIDPKVFEETYLNADGRKITIDKLEKQGNNAGQSPVVKAQEVQSFGADHFPSSQDLPGAAAGRVRSTGSRSGTSGKKER